MGSLSALNVSTSCTTLARFGIVTPEKRCLFLYFCEKIAMMGISSQLFENMLDRSRSTIQL